MDGVQQSVSAAEIRESVLDLPTKPSVLICFNQNPLFIRQPYCSHAVAECFSRRSLFTIRSHGLCLFTGLVTAGTLTLRTITDYYIEGSTAP